MVSLHLPRTKQHRLPISFKDAWFPCLSPFDILFYTWRLIIFQFLHSDREEKRHPTTVPGDSVAGEWCVIVTVPFVGTV